MGSDVQFSFTGSIKTDFDLTSQDQTPYTNISAVTGVWDESNWDGSYWGGEVVPFAQWKYSGRMGHYASYRIKTSSKSSDIRYYATDYVFEAGGVL